MFRLLLNSGERLVGWAQHVIGCTFFPDAQAIGWGNDDEIRAACIYDRWTVRDVHIHVASDETGHFGTRQFLAAAFHFPFVVADRHRITGLVPASNDRARRLNAHLGFKPEGVMRGAGDDGEDIIILGMLRSECRFIPREHRGA